MSRCKACNKVLEDEELLAVRIDGEPEDLCRECVAISEKSLEQEQESFDKWLDLYDDFI